MGFRLGFLLFAIFFLALFLIASIFQFNHRWNERYNLKNHFPYELNYGIKFSDNIYGNISIIALALVLGAFYATMDLTFVRTFFIPVMVSGILSALVIPLIVIIPASSMKTHIGVLLVLILASVLLPGTIGIAALQIYQNEGNSPLAIVVLCLTVIVAIGIVVIMFNPKLSLRMEVTEVEKPNGEKEYKRPKTIPLAITEWMLVFSIFISSILLFILLLIC